VCRDEGRDFRGKLTGFRAQFKLPVTPLNQSRWSTTYHLKVTQVTLRDQAKA
jgi:hypothetical protein